MALFNTVKLVFFEFDRENKNKNRKLQKKEICCITNALIYDIYYLHVYAYTRIPFFFLHEQ